MKSPDEFKVRDLPPKERARFGLRSIKKHDVAIILLHWFNTLCWILLLVTGTALFTGPDMSITPIEFNQIIIDIFRGKARLLSFHIAVGSLWVFVLSFNLVVGIGSHVRSVLRAVMLDRDDWQWIVIKPLKILGLTNKHLPPQGSYNAGQKLFAWSVYTMVPLIMASGLIMGYSLIHPAVIRWAIVIHGAAVGVVVAGLIIHAYMAGVMPEEKPAFFSMFTGRVNALFAYLHHRKFWQRRVAQEYSWNRKHLRVNAAENRHLVPLSLPIEQDLEELSLLIEEEKRELSRPRPFWNPYVTGVLLGLVLFFVFWTAGRGFGGSGGLASIEAWLLHLASPDWAEGHGYWSKYFKGGKNPIFSFASFMSLGILLGGWLSGRHFNRFRIRIVKGHRISKRQRLFLAVLGGTLVGFGARMARGCISSLALSGGVNFGMAAWIFILTFFVTGFLVAYFIRRTWL